MSNLRDLILNHRLKTEDVPTPFWSEKDEQGNELVDGHVAMRDIPTDELIKLQTKLAKEPEVLIGAILCKALINKDTGQRIFEDADRDAVAKRGSSELLPVFQQCQKFFGLDEGAVEAAKKNFEMTPNGSSGSTSVRSAHLAP